MTKSSYSFAKFPNILLGNPHLNLSDIHVFLAVMSVYNLKNGCTLSTKSIAEKIKMDERTVRRSLERLAKPNPDLGGPILIIERRKDKKNMDISKRIFVNENLFFEGGEEGGCARGGRAAVPSYHCSSSQGERGGEEGGCALPHKKKIHKEDIEEAGSSSPIPSATTEILEGFEHLRITPKRMEILCNRFGPELVNSTALALDAELDSTSVVDHGKKLTNWLNHAQKSSSREQESGTPPYAPRPPRELSAAAAELVADLTERHGSYQPRGPFIFFAKRDAESYLLRLHDENGSAIEASELVVYRKHASLERELKRHLAKLQKDLEILTKGVSDE